MAEGFIANLLHQIDSDQEVPSPMSQPLNKLAPFVVHGVNGEVILQVNQQGVQVLNIIFPDGSVLTSAGVSTSPINSEDVDCGTF